MRTVVPIKLTKVYIGYKSDSSVYTLLDRDPAFQKLFFKVGGNVLCFEDELVAYVAEKRETAPAYDDLPDPEPVKRGRGRPRKTAETVPSPTEPSR